MCKKLFSQFCKLVALSCLFFALEAHTAEQKDKPQEFVVGLQSGYPPYESLDEMGEVIGFDVDIAKKIAEKLGKQLVIQQMSFDALILSLKQHKIDVIISGLSITKERQKEIFMVPYHGEKESSVALVFWEQMPSYLRTLEDLKGKKNPTVSVQSGTMQEEMLQSYSYIIPKALDNITELLMDVKYKKSVAAYMEPKIAKELALKYKQVKWIEVPLPSDKEFLGEGIGIAKDNLALKEQIEVIIAELKASGEIMALHQKWFKGDSVTNEQ